MWFKSIYLKTLREFRIAMFSWGIGMGLLMYAVLAAVPSLLTTPQARASLIDLAKEFAWFADPVGVDTPGGYVTWKYGLTILVIAIWPLLTCSRIIRGEEERGSLDVLLSLPQGRVRILLEKLAAVWTTLLIMGLLITLLTFGGGQSVSANFTLGDALLFSLNVILIGGFFGSLTLFISQFTQERRTATGWTTGLLILFILLDIVHRVIPGTEWISQISPIYYYNLSKPLVPGYGTNPGAMLLLLALNILLSGAALFFFRRRDVGGTVALPAFLHQPARTVSREKALPVNAWSLRSIYTRSLGMIIAPTCWWTLAIAGLAGWMVAIVKQTEANMATLFQSSPVLKDLLTKVGGGDIATNATILSALFVFLPVLIMIFAITQANRWSADEEEGRLDLVLSTPQPRLRVLLGRFAALTTATICISVVTLAVTALAALASGLSLDDSNLAAATLSIIPLGLLMAALGYLLAGWLRTAIDTGLLSFLLIVWFFISFVGPGLNWSETTLRLSAFYYYGTPLLHGLPFLDMLGVLAVAVVALAVASIRFIRKDIGR
ncbi:ABC transporter permease subunit [Tengunoibacter tsumagoiensis]|uniref:ABC transporter permease n=1 Tax=Tengunoibacter tsumagoiensis TaxID=2014871 RepID=A0A402A795_9CHLR|nr:ABC transporter permease subunit [Tengunoibacter tsumagoiensis]GCE14978.1 hypothetical protein KTT_48370 [Tengunoibacter tsumagoiensis]